MHIDAGRSYFQTQVPLVVQCLFHGNMCGAGHEDEEFVGCDRPLHFFVSVNVLQYIFGWCNSAILGNSKPFSVFVTLEYFLFSWFDHGSLLTLPESQIEWTTSH